MNETIRLGVTLMIVAIIAGAGLALTNKYTGPQIEVQKELVVKESLNKVVVADSFKEEERYYDAYDKEGGLLGKVLKVEAPGYSSTIVALVGIDLDNKITGIEVINQQETPGLGANIEKEDFLKQFIGKDEVKLRKDGGEIDGVTGATISSRALTDGVREMMEECPCDATTSASPEYIDESLPEIEEELEEMDEELTDEGIKIIIDGDLDDEE